MARINAVLEMPAEPSAESLPAACSAGHTGIELRGLTFSYAAGAKPVLRDMSMVIPADATIGITGTTGAGKSTLCNLLLRFLIRPATQFL